MRRFRNWLNFPPSRDRKPLCVRRGEGVKKVLAGPEVSAVSPLSPSGGRVKVKGSIWDQIRRRLEGSKRREGERGEGGKFRGGFRQNRMEHQWAI